MRYIGIIFAVLFIIILFFFGIASFMKQTPATTKELFKTKDFSVLSANDTFHVLIWNIGYGGLDKDMDFFYDGGRQVVSDKETVRQNMDEIEALLKNQADVKFFLLQEVDIFSRRSGYVNEVSFLKESMPEYNLFFAKNYDAWFVPVPLRNPLGRVHSGLVTLSRYTPMKATQHPLPGSFFWPKSLFMPDRCILVNHYTMNNGKKLLLINLHLSAYDDGNLKKKEMNYIKKWMTEQYQKGHYIIAGGDWNQLPPSHSEMNFASYKEGKLASQISGNFMPESWMWRYEPTVPTNRSLKAPFHQSTTPTTLLDFYLLSPNISAINVETIDLGFEHSDHQPVKIEFKVK